MHITAAEAHVMEALWRRSPLSADELVAEVGGAQNWGEATVKTFQRKDGHVWLLPHNPDYSPIDGTHASIMGTVVAGMRRL